MILFCYICVGALINSLLEKLSFIDGLYFTLVSIESIGFGDIVPTSTGSRFFVCIYSTIGFLNLGVAIVMCRETVLEAMEVAYRKRARELKERWKEARAMRRVEIRWRCGIQWRLEEMGAPVWVRDENSSGHTGGRGRSLQQVTIGNLKLPRIRSRSFDVDQSTDRSHARSHSTHGPPGMRLNLQALTRAQLEASALEAGVPLDTLLPVDFVPAATETADDNSDEEATVRAHPAAGWIDTLASRFGRAQPTQSRNFTHARLGGMSALLTRFAVAAVHGHATKPVQHSGTSDQNGEPADEAVLSEKVPNNLQTNPSPKLEAANGISHLDYKLSFARSSDKLNLETLRDLDTKAFYLKLLIAWSLFFLFWTVSS
jgi:hypothetical protein